MFNTQTGYEVVTFSIGDTKAGTKMGKLQLRNPEDDTILNCILWEETLGRLNNKMFRNGNILRIITASYNEKYNNCLVSDLELVEEAKLGLNDEQTQSALNKLKLYIEKITDPKLQEYIKSLFKQYEKEFITVPAAKLMHHNYKGGLLQHTVECLEIADSLINLFKEKVNKDNAYAACILHDFGKIFEYEMDYETGLIEYNEDFRKNWLSHSQWGYTQCMIQGFETIAKMIAAHHSRTDWGAMIDLGEKDLEPYYYFLHHVDDLSAKYGKITIKDL